MESIKTKKNSPVAGPSKRIQTKIFQDNASKDLKTTRQRSTVPSPEVNTPPAVHHISDSDISPHVTTPITPHLVVAPPAAHHISDYDTSPDVFPSTPPTKTNPQVVLSAAVIRGESRTPASVSRPGPSVSKLLPSSRCFYDWYKECPNITLAEYRPDCVVQLLGLNREHRNELVNIRTSDGAGLMCMS